MGQGACRLLERDESSPFIHRGTRTDGPPNGLPAAVVAERPPPSGAFPPARWLFRPSARSEPRRDEAAAFRARLETALRVGHGLGVEFGLRLSAAPEPAIVAIAESAVSRRWLARVFSTAYERHQWEAYYVPHPPETSGGLYGRRIGSWPETLRSAFDTPSILDAWASAFAALPTGIVLTARFHPLPAPSSHWWEANPIATQPRRAPYFPGKATFSAAATPPIAVVGQPVRPLLWAGSFHVTVRGPPNGHPVGAVERTVAAALERSCRTEAGSGLRFRSGVGFPGRSVPQVPIAVEELSLFLPGPECPAPGDSAKEPGVGTLLPIGRTSAGTVVGPVIERGQGRHLAVLGETGMGKSSLLVALARRAARTSGVILLDPLGETARSLEEELGPDERRRSIGIAPGNGARRVNALEGIAPSAAVDPVRSERRLNDLVHSLRRVRSGRYTDSAYWGPRLEEMVTRAVRAAAAWPHGTLVDAHTLLATGARLHREIPPDAVGPVRELAERIRERPEDAEGARRLLYEIVRSPVLERMLCAATPDLRTAELVAPGRIVTISGDAPRVGESTARYLLSVYLALVWSEVLSRSQASKTFVILDEAQWFSHESLAEMLRLGRRANLHVVLATQSIASLPDVVTEAVWTNVSDFVAFRGSPEESREFARAARGVTTDAILSQPRGHAAVLLGKGHTVRWLRTVRLPGKAHRSSKDPDGPRREEGLSPKDPFRPRPDAESVARVPGRAANRLPEGTGVAPTPAEVIELLRRRAEEVPPGSSLEVSLAELRRAVDPGGTAVRVAGAVLRRAGAIVAVEHNAAGGVWRIAPDRIPPPGRFGTSENPPAGSQGAQPS